MTTVSARDNVGSLLWLLALLCVATAMRFKGIWFGYPLPVHPDEPILVETALRMIDTGDLNPHFFNYPTLNIYLHAALYRAVQLFGHFILGKAPTEIPVIWYYIAGRTLNVLLSVSTILVTYMIGKRLFSPLAGFCAALFLTFSFLHVANSFLVTVDSSVALWSTLTTLMAVLIVTEGKKPKYYLLGAVFAGLAISSKYTAFVCVAPLLIAHYTQRHGVKASSDKDIIACLLVIPIVFVLTSPYVLLDFSNFMMALKIEAAHYSTGHPGAQSDTSTSYYLYGQQLIVKDYGIVPTALAGFGIIWLLRKASWKATIILATPMLLFAFVGQYKVFFARNIVAAVPFLSLLSGAFVFLLYEASREKLSYLLKARAASVTNLALVVVLAASVWKQAAFAFDYLETINLPDTRWVSMDWINENLPRDIHIGREHYTPPIEKYLDKFRAEYLGFFAVAEKPYDVSMLDYMIVSSGDYDRFLSRPDLYDSESRAYRDFFERHELIKEFVPDGKELTGPRISIYRIRY